jgi:hypothetical protein
MVGQIRIHWGADVYGRVHHFYTHTLPGLAAVPVVFAGVEMPRISSLSFARPLVLNPAGLALHLLGDLVKDSRKSLE